MIKISEELGIPMFSDEEIKRRWEAIRRLMIPRKFDCLLIIGDRNANDIQYVSGLCSTSGSEYCIFPLYGDPSIYGYRVMLARYLSCIPEAVSNFGYNIGYSPLQALPLIVKRLKALGLEKGTIALDPMGTIALDVYNVLRKELPQANFVGAGEIVSECSIVKSPVELEFIRKAQECAEKGFLAMANAARPGATMYEITGACIGAIIAAGGDLAPFLVYDKEDMHWPYKEYDKPPTGSAHKLKKGDVICMEIGPTIGANYYSPFCLPISLGKPSAEFVEEFEFAKKQYCFANDLLRPGVNYQQFNTKIAEFIRINKPASFDVRGLTKDGFVESYKRIAPWMGFPGQTTPYLGELKPGIIVRNMPGTQLGGGKGKTHICGDCVIITEGKPEGLSKLPMEITVV